MTRREFLALSSFAGLAAAFGGTPSALAAADRVTVGVLGLGPRGLAHLDAFLRMPGVAVAAICDAEPRALQSGAELCAAHGARVPELLASWRAVLDRTDLDAVAVATPRDTRFEIVVAACMAGKDVISERPAHDPDRLNQLAMTASEYGRLVEQATFARSRGELDRDHTLRFEDLLTLRSAIVHRSASQQRHERSPFAPTFDDFDYARALLDVHAPRLVTTAEMVDLTRQRLLRAEARFVFSGDEGDRTIVLAVKPRPTHTPADDSSVVEARGPAGAFAVRRLGTRRANDPIDLWQNFVACVRSRKGDDLCSPLVEGVRTAALIGLADLALEAKAALRLDAGAYVPAEAARLAVHLAPTQGPQAVANS